MATFYANPYSIDNTGFYFDDDEKSGEDEDEVAAYVAFVTDRYATFNSVGALQDAMREAEDNFRGEMTIEDAAHEFVEEGIVGDEQYEFYFDYESFGRDLGFDLDPDEDEFDAELYRMGNRERVRSSLIGMVAYPNSAKKHFSATLTTMHMLMTWHMTLKRFMLVAAHSCSGITEQ